MGQIGAIVALEASRLALRQSHRLRSVPLSTPPSRQAHLAINATDPIDDQDDLGASESISAISS
jgi:hypothetical protein